ncbi:methyltransferase 1 [Sesbania bispinosa]|nr:methyltransferase 1 [Sesbania bispinosa]
MATWPTVGCDEAMHHDGRAIVDGGSYVTAGGETEASKAAKVSFTKFTKD